jgi:uncharacterized membrane protein YgaE (UPF0421/DUF939 family)
MTTISDDTTISIYNTITIIINICYRIFVSPSSSVLASGITAALLPILFPDIPQLHEY